MGSAPQLAAMLLTSAPGKTYQGLSFPDLMLGDDANRFRHYIATGLHESHAQSLNVHLRVAGGQRVQVKLLHSSFEDFNDQVRHIVGICELSDAEREDQVKMIDGRLPPSPDTIPSMPHCLLHGGAPGVRTASESGQSSHYFGSGHSDGSSARCSMMDVARPLPHKSARGVPPDFAVLCDALSDDLRILKSTMEFALMCGVHPEGLGLLDWIADPLDFMLWFQVQLNGASATMLPMPLSCRRIVLQSPLAKRLGVQLEAVCLLSFSEVDIEEDDGDDALPVRIAFSKIRRHHVRAPRATTGVPQEWTSAEGSREEPRERERRRRMGTRSSGSSQ
eukprot:gnl/TRDRNA2_/TRDRNA2_175660_c1_seq1.p1 gnl/TRDRNA2_/TRDRNA2_175660_c1~~gnl/TRDRNA2_/TRDRNA2_175660_c1_seq1.p1  ORF type:complete len:357 (+),score=39.34 gnl/TRDRNA2_/TRDRNA2_175660_c1_seq1:72-1073(+)